MRLGIVLPEAVLAGVATNAQHAALAQSRHQVDELMIIACKESRITELRRLITQSREIGRDMAARQLAERHRHRQRSRLCKKAAGRM